jgi:hypothetical protein
MLVFYTCPYSDYAQYNVDLTQKLEQTFFGKVDSEIHLDDFYGF